MTGRQDDRQRTLGKYMIDKRGLWIFCAAKRVSSDHRLNMELDLRSILGLHVHTAQLYTHRLRPHNPPFSSRIWAHIRGRYRSAKIDDISLWPPASDRSLPSIINNICKWFWFTKSHEQISCHSPFKAWGPYSQALAHICLATFMQYKCINPMQAHEGTKYTRRPRLTIVDERFEQDPDVEGLKMVEGNTVTSIPLQPPPHTHISCSKIHWRPVPRRLFFTALQWIAITQSPKIHQKNEL